MKRLTAALPALTMAALALALLVHGPIPQWPGYHDFADLRMLAGIPRAADVLSNVGFAVVGIVGLVVLNFRGGQCALGAAWSGYAMFLVALVLTALGSGFYHLVPDNARLVWDRLPVALACAGLLAGVRADTHADGRAHAVAAALAVAAIASVLWWHVTETRGQGDLRPYILIQAAPLLLVPLWQARARAPRADRLAFGAALVLYLVARAAELNDRAVFDALGWISGHTIKHLLATCAAAVIVARLVARSRARSQIPAAPRLSSPHPLRTP
ncbi:MAG TPA: hypothetical protein VMG60_01235 [Burkholderiaceae bacterium]|nr:hypothetical protein [Burkholderiaceae bacterium]